MKSMKRVLSTVIASGISVFSFAQVNLGLQSTTQAAINATAVTKAITSTTNAATQATKATVNSTVVKVGEIKSTTAAKVNGTGKQTLATSKEIGNSVNANAGFSSSTGEEVKGQGFSLGSDNSISANADINSDKLVNKAEQTTTAGIITAKDVKSKTVSDLKSDVTTVKQTTSGVQPSIEAKGSSESNATASVK